MARAAGKRSRKDDESILRRHLVPAFGTLPLTAINAQELERFKGTLAKLAPKTVANILTLLLTMLGHAHDLGWIHAVPRVRKPKPAARKKPANVLRTASDLDRFLAAAELRCDRAHALYAAAIYTGARAGELAGLRWEDVDFEGATLTFRRRYQHASAPGAVRRVRVCSALLEILRRRRAKTLGPVVFPNEKGGALGPSGRAFQETLHEVLAQAGFPLVEREGKLRPHLRFEDLRHSFAAQWMMRGGSISTLQQMLGHKSAEMTARYSAFAPDRSAEDLERFSGFPSS